jgi:hypothetical protein
MGYIDSADVESIKKNYIVDYQEKLIDQTWHNS